MSLSKSFNELFIIPEKRKNQKKDSCEYIRELKIRKVIHEFTKKTVSDRKKEKLLKKLEKKHIINSYKIDGKSLIIETEDKSIKIEKLTDCFEQLRDDNDIETEDRMGQCHIKSMVISRALDVDNEVVTGYIFGVSNENKYLHSWVEFKKKEEEFVADYTKNLLISKDAYYYLYHCKPLNRIKNKNLMKDLLYITKKAKLGDCSVKEYLVFSDEIMKDLSKNRDIIESKSNKEIDDQER